MSLNTKMSPPQTKAKFTRGEKCIFVHLIVTFVIILVMIIIYSIHLYLVKHYGNELFRIYRRSFQNQDSFKSEDDDSFSVGVLYTNVINKVICHTLLLRNEWSLAPAHCIAIRSDPNMAYLLNTWTVKYINSENHIIDTPIKRSIIHAQFNSDNFENNIGLIEHIKPILLREYQLAPLHFIKKEKMLRRFNGRTEIIGWDFSETRRSETLSRKLYTSTLLTNEKCNIVISPIIDRLRNYELCATVTHDYEEAFVYHGAILASDSEVIGFFSWGDKRSRGVPFIVLNINYYKNWLENVIKI